jgi:dTDP-4-amino-4,6-dideoxygalactose transaminase
VAQAIEQAGARIHFFNQQRDLSIDWDDVQNTLRADRGIRALLWYHYLGLPAEFDAVRGFCGRHGLLFIEDCAHALFTSVQGRSCGRAGDIAIFSLRKTLPVLHAGALVVNRRKYRLRSAPCAVAPSHAYRQVLDRIELFRHRQYAQSLDTRRLVLRDDFREFHKLASRHQSRLDRVYRLDEVSHAVLQNADPQAIRAARNRNFRTYLRHLRSIGVFKAIPRGACPLAFPIWTRERDRLRQRLEARGVEALTYWPDWLLPKGVARRYANIKWLADSILALPCHQDLGAAEIEYVCQAVQACA